MDQDSGTIIDWEGNGEAKPLHFHPNASLEKFSPDDPYTSSIFRVSYARFLKMSPQAIRAVFRDRHILVYDVPREEQWSWSPESFEQLCPLDTMVETQGRAQVFTISVIAGSHCLADMAFRDMDDETIQTNTWHPWEFVMHTAPPAPDTDHTWEVNGAMVNVLDLPRQRDELERIPRWRCVFSLLVTSFGCSCSFSLATFSAPHPACIPSPHDREMLKWLPHHLNGDSFE